MDVALTQKFLLPSFEDRQWERYTDSVSSIYQLVPAILLELMALLGAELASVWGVKTMG